MAIRSFEFAKAMKEIDPAIQIGAAFVTPPDGSAWAPDWNATVLKKACAAIDFETIDWLAGNTTQESNWKTLDEGGLFTNARDKSRGYFHQHSVRR